MTESELFTRCPTCRTVFRTHEAQLSMQAGKVRCGQCRMVFDGRAHLVDLSPGAAHPDDDDAVGPPTVTLRDSVALQPVPPPPEDRASEAEDGSQSPADGIAADVHVPSWVGATESADHPDSTSAAPVESPEVAIDPPLPSADSETHAASAAAPAAAQADEAIVPYDWQEEARPMRPAVRWSLAVVAVLLFVLLAGQGVFFFRNAIAAHYPEWRPALVEGCARVGCALQPVHSRDDITIESHDLQADPAHQGLLILQLTLRNRANHAVAFPHLELEILDLGGQPQVRRALAPTEYAGGAADFTRGMPAGAEWNVKLFLDASSVNARGYNLDLFYP